MGIYDSSKRRLDHGMCTQMLQVHPTLYSIHVSPTINLLSLASSRANESSSSVGKTT